ncbi:MAG: Hdr-like menaquinol oxidoreductase cytochrome c subunit [Gammaproteobacteria bacterium]|nr:Hdr-like menaquinol oxidoreductase cytochrome c subunit [Gammaproteobacteria bacterium]
MYTRRQCLLIGIGLGLITISMASDKLTGSHRTIPGAVQGESCVGPVEVMRREHMTMLFHQRDRTMYAGQRDAEHSLTGCLSCHTRKNVRGEYIPVNAPGEFCEECHAYTALKMDCFECHAATPGNAVASTQ